ncbi:MAG: nucleotidyltransferase domain-containing protein [Bryobacteraceae bacterium]
MSSVVAIKSRPGAPGRVGSPVAEIGLLQCARVEPDQDAIQAIQALGASPGEWARLVSLASAHQVLPLVYWNLSRFHLGVPAGVMRTLRRGFEENVLGNLALAAELREILALFSSKNVPIVPFKGPICALSLYGALLLRAFGDLDVLVHPCDVTRAKELLLSMGYYVDQSRPHAPKHLVFVRGGHGPVIELHRAFFEPSMACHIDVPRLWNRLKEVDFCGIPTLSLHPEDQILILAIHGANHGWPILKWVCDIAEFTRVHDDLDWEGVLRQAGRAGCRRIILVGLAAAQKLLGTRMPAACTKAASDPLIDSLAEGVRARLFAEHAERLPGSQAVIPAADAHRALMNCRERPWDRMALLLCYVRDRLKPSRLIRLVQVYGWKSVVSTARMLLIALFRPSLQN